MSIFKESYEYEPVGDEEHSDQAQRNDHQRWYHKILKCHSIAALVSAVFVVTVGISFLLGYKYSQLQHTRYDLESSLPLERIIINQGPNRAYLQRSSPESDALWAKLYPQDGRGVFLDRVNGSKIVGFAGFHALHCVNTLLKRHYQHEDIRDAFLQGDKMPTFEAEITDTHALHCIEMLRQATLCHADSTMLFEVEAGQGLPAFNSDFECRNWQQLVDHVDWLNEVRGPWY